MAKVLTSDKGGSQGEGGEQKSSHDVLDEPVFVSAKETVRGRQEREENLRDEDGGAEIE